MSRQHRPAFRRGALATLAAAALIALSACGGSDGSSAKSDGPVQEGGTLKLAFNQDLFGNLDPNQNFWIESRSIDRNLVDSLTDQDPKTGKIVPWLATKWTVSPDAKTYTFTLRDGVTFSDGTPLDAKAVKTAYDGIVKLGPLASLGATYLSGYKETKVLAPNKIEVDFTTANAAFLQATSTTTLGILSPKSYDIDPKKRALGDFVGSGPFTLTSYKVAQSVKLAKRKDYAWGSEINKNRKAAHIDALDVTFVPEESVLVGSLTSKQIDVAWPRNPLSEQSQQTITSGGGTVDSTVLPGLTYNLIPNVKGILGDAKVREALQKSIDRTEWAHTLFGDDYPVTKSVIDSSTPQWSDQSALLAYDPDGAAKLLDEAGWKKGSGAYRTKDGKPLEISFLTVAPWPGWDLLQDQLKKVGIKLTQKVVTPAENTAKANNGDFDLTASYFTRADADVLRTFYDTNVVKPGTGPGAYTQDPATAKALSALYAQEISEADPVKRKAIFAEIQKQIITAGVLFPLQDRAQIVATTDQVHDLDYTAETFLRLNDVWLSK
ncbi:ABC transporter substrate-binding protein [Aeromicrobium ginsengisoli]|uniref:ABC transporter substrate-binding protein n=1 Tax=Aeromicrobium ginsengisoli TaxID=363867 RepID=A0A5M4FA28_9ACTN|nr:ABC transporter substrate-binding protein [Aeromicrobium ginsengisoli]KAA1395137.1 ABC transporter substrate-binding protein [Aeromicrobium ginsengisoli]